MESLFGEEFEIKIKKPKTKDVLKKLDEISENEVDVDKLLKSKSISINDKLRIITDKVYRVLGKQINNTVVLKTKEDYFAYIDKAIEVGRIAVDTETNNSLDPVTCKLMGLCLYAPGQKQAYIPCNHVDPNTKIRLSWQLTEDDIKQGLVKIVLAKQLNPNFLIIMHNGKFDYSVLKCTCGVAVVPDWDTMVCARLLNENERAGLKEQYISKIDPDQEKYSIEHLFTNILYAYVDPKVFALYAATDSMMTDKLYEWQVVEMAKPEYGAHMDITGTHQIKGLRWLFHKVEMPIVIVTAEMELKGVCIDTEFGERLKEKYNAQLEITDDEINKILEALRPAILKWSLTDAATSATRVYVPKKTKMSEEKIAEQYPKIDDEGNRYKIGKSKASQLTDPVNLASPVQLAILFYDVLNIGSIYNKDTRGTGKNELKDIAELLKKFVETATREQLEKAIEADDDLGEDVETDDEGNVIKSTELKEGVDTEAENHDEENETVLDANTAKLAADLCVLLLKRRGLAKLLTTYIEVIPTLAKHWPDSRIRFHLNSLGTDTGRYSSGGKWKFPDAEGNSIQVSGINIQNIPSHNPEIRMLFKAREDTGTIEAVNNTYTLPEITELETIVGYKYGKDLKVGDVLDGSVANPGLVITEINYNNKTYSISVSGTTKLLNTRTQYKIIGSDYSAQEPRMTTFLSGDKQMYQAYTTGKDLYAMIAQSAFGNNYEDNLEFYPEGTEIEIDGNKVICGHKTHLNKAGKERRSVGKVLNLAATYGMGGATAGSRLGKTAKEGTQLLNNFFGEFSGVKKAIDDSKEFLKTNGYVEDFVGRRRRLSDINLIPYEILSNRKGSNFNPFIGCADRSEKVESLDIWQRILDAYVILSNIHRCRQAHKDGMTYEPNRDMSKQAFEHLQKIGLGATNELTKPWSNYWTTPVAERILTDINTVLDYHIKSDGIYRKWSKDNKTGKCYVVSPTSKSAIPVSDPAIKAMEKEYVEKYGDKPLKEIPKDSVILRAWTGRIAQASRQCFNARIQGSAASLTKMAMVDIYNDQKLRDLDAHLIITVHDEVLVECPALYADQVEERLPEIMINAAKEGGDDVPQSCDPYNVSRWYADTAAASIQEEFKKLEKGNPDKNIAPLPRDEALQKVIDNHIEIPQAAIIKTVETGCDLDF